MEVLRFIEARFRMGIRISQAEMDAYYTGTLIRRPGRRRLRHRGDDDWDNIQEILLQQQVDKLRDDWLTSLRAEARGGL